MSLQPSIAIVLLNYNGQLLLEKNLPFLYKTTYANKTIVVIDNGSSDDSISFLQQQHPTVQVVPLGSNKGYTGGYNEGLKQVEADYYILLNTDVEVTAEFIEPLIDTLTANPNGGICQPKILSIENRHLFEYAGAAGGFLDKYGYTFARGRILDQSEEDNGQYDDTCQLFWASGSCLLIKSSLFWELNGFYDYYFMYAEEVDLCWRAQLKGYEVYYCPSSVVYHKETVDFAKQSPKRIYYVFRNNLVLLFRNLTLADKLWVIPARIVLNLAAAFYFFLRGYFKKSLLVVKSIFAAIKWLMVVPSPTISSRKRLKSIKTVYKGSILADYYFRKKRVFSALDKKKF